MNKPVHIKVVNSIKETSEILEVCNQTTYNEINKGLLKTFKIGRRRFVSGDALREYIKDREKEAAA